MCGLYQVEGPSPAACHRDQTYSEKRGHNFVLTATFSEVHVDDYDALVIPGEGYRNWLLQVQVISRNGSGEL